MIVLGLLIGFVGTDIYTGTLRYTFGRAELFDGIDIVAISIGLFGIAEILKNLEDEQSRPILVQRLTGILPSKDDLRRIIKPAIRGTAHGSLLGVLPGGGATLSAFASYAVEKRISPNADQFGNGAIEGVAAPEAANNAGAQTSFIPMLSLGVPANPVMALMIGAFAIHGITPGPNIATNQPELFWGVIASMWVGNVFLVVLNLPLIGLWVKLLSIPYNILVPAILAFSAIGVYSVDMNLFEVYAIALFGFIGYMLIKLDCEPAPLLLGFVLGPLLEENLRRAMILSRGDFSTFVTRPISATLLVIAAIVLVVVLLPSVRRKREEVFVEEE